MRVLKIPDKIFLFDIYSAGEADNKDISTKMLMKSINHPEMYHLSNFKNAKNTIIKLIEDDSILIIMGAGSIGNFVQQIIKK